ncbi:MAG: hypothetical protein E6K16_04085 [Methanobacteriota archaeon]|nr:MAG: hypothetical protein E6K16_04085 [Euryarchaeota archaeon]
MAGTEKIPGDRVVGKTRHTELSVDEIAELQHGLSDLMDVLARRFWVMAYAARGGNWDLARYEWRESGKLLHQMAKTRPKYAEDLVEFEKASFAAVGAGLEAGDLPSVEAAMRAAIEASDRYHGKWQKPYLRFRLPNRPPDFLDTRGDR